MYTLKRVGGAKAGIKRNAYLTGFQLGFQWAFFLNDMTFIPKQNNLGTT